MKKRRWIYFIIIFFSINLISYIISNRDDNLIIELEATIDNNSQTELYYVNGTESFSDERMILGDWNKNEITFILQDKDISAIRIDFSNKISKVKLSNISFIENPFFKRTLTADKIKDCITEINNIDKVTIINGDISFKTMGRDGYFIIKGYEDSFVTQINVLGILKEILFIIVTCLLLSWKKIFLYFKDVVGYKLLLYYCIAISVGLYIAYNWAPKDTVILTLFFIVFTLEAVRLCLKNCLDFSNKDIVAFIKNNKAYFALVVVSIIGYLPLLSIPFSFQDEYASFPGYRVEQINYSYGRAIQSLIGKIFTFVSYDNIYYTRWFASVFAILFTFIIYSYVLKHSKRKKYSFIVSLVIGATNVVVDCVAYAAIMSYMYGIFMIAMSFVLYEETERPSKHRYLYSFIFAFLALNAYQLVIPILVLLFTIKVWHSSESFMKNLIGILKYFLICILCAAAYLGYIKIFTTGLGASASSRSSIISSPGELVAKVNWFLDYIFKQAGYRIISIFTGSNIFFGERMWAKNAIKFSEGIICLINVMVYITPISAILWKVREKKDILEGIYYFISIPASFIVFLLLKENGYMTYYMYTLIALLIFYYIGFFDLLFKRLKITSNSKSVAIIAITILIGYNSYMYSLNGWVMPQVRSHDFVKNTLLNQLDEEKKEIYIIGTPNRWQANAYATMLVKNVLVELGRDDRVYDIKNSDVDGLIGIMEQDVYKNAMEYLTDSEKAEFSSYYYFSEDYVQYHLIRENLNDESISRLKYLMKKCGLLPKNESEAVIIDLSWVNKN